MGLLHTACAWCAHVQAAGQAGQQRRRWGGRLIRVSEVDRFVGEGSARVWGRRTLRAHGMRTLQLLGKGGSSGAGGAGAWGFEGITRCRSGEFLGGSQGSRKSGL